MTFRNPITRLSQLVADAVYSPVFKGTATMERGRVETDLQVDGNAAISGALIVGGLLTTDSGGAITGISRATVQATTGAGGRVTIAHACAKPPEVLVTCHTPGVHARVVAATAFDFTVEVQAPTWTTTTTAGGKHTHPTTGTTSTAGSHTHPVVGSAAGDHSHTVTGTAAEAGEHTHPAATVVAWAPVPAGQTHALTWLAIA